MVKLEYPGIVPYSMDGYLHTNFSDVKKIVEEKKQSFILVNDGRTGLGKTTFSFQQAMFFAGGDKKKFNLNHVLFDPEPSFEIVSNAKKGDVFVFDEAVIFNSRSALSKYNKTMLLLLSTIRSKQIYIILNLPSFFDLDRAITMDKAYMLIHLYGKHFGDKGNYLVFDDKRMKNLYLFGKKTYNYGCVKPNFFSSFNKPFVLDEDEYEKKKKIAVKKMIASSDATSTTRIRLQRDLLISYLNQIYSVTYSKINEVMPRELTLGASTMSDATRRIRKRYNPIWFRNRIEEEDYE